MSEPPTEYGHGIYIVFLTLLSKTLSNQEYVLQLGWLLMRGLQKVMQDIQYVKCPIWRGPRVVPALREGIFKKSRSTARVALYFSEAPHTSSSMPHPRIGFAKHCEIGPVHDPMGN